MKNGRRFDPDNDRLARDIRNTLARALMTTLERMEIDPVIDLATNYLDRPLASAYHAYVRERVDRYRLAVSLMAENNVADPFAQALILWNYGLFFEVHERLEGIWKKAAGRRRQALQALIRAAGTYVLLANGRYPAAASMAAKAKTGLENYADTLVELTDIRELSKSLQNLDLPPPKLFARKT
ncbi:MAG: DUF309 domain-containing protein [Deltaproteobacteria bacterium]|nr:DUF309 domain-containing protein [Deltaproteobacteria bacterium]